MSASVTTKAVSAISRWCYVHGLKERGWKRQGDHFHRRSEDLFHGIHFQASAWGTASRGKFTINLAVVSPLLYEAWMGTSMPKNPATANAPFPCRIGRLMAERRDHLWTVDGRSNIERLATEIAALLVGPAQDFFADYPNLQAFARRLRGGRVWLEARVTPKPIVLAVAEHVAGNDRAARERLMSALRKHRRQPFAQTVSAVAQRIGITLDETDGEPDGPANQSQPIRAETSRPSVAAGSDR